MKLYILFAILSGAYGYAMMGYPQSNTEILSMIQNSGYPVKNYTVQTKDGYILELFRIPHGQNQQDSTNDNTNTDNSDSDESNETKARPAIMLLHGLMSSAEDFVVGGPQNSLAMALADKGYDVFLANSRGSTYGTHHVGLNPGRDSAFWKFCWDDVASKDLPVIISKILSLTKLNKIDCVGHMEGATALLVLLSQKPNYNQKFNRLVTLGPVAFMEHSSNRVVKKIVDNYSSNSWMMQNIGMNMFTPSNELVGDLQTECTNLRPEQQMCTNAYFLFNGYDSQSLNLTTIEKLVKRIPYGGPVQQFKHFAQLMQTHRFQPYDSSFGEKRDSDQMIPEYDLAKVSIPVAVYYTPKDSLSNVRDIEMLVERLPNVQAEQNYNELTNNVDLLYAENVYSMVYSNVIEFLMQYQTMA